ncbi:MAG: hypothetical protein CMC70_11920 [Flavobacteriaceae bacterium]|nr:hypothetical protein [Flavobacteriaceae bacterium]|tara:strand:+ start:277 stop:627 length:351 start_codon:yes stop_codon:yes gene_type:complete
MTYKLESQRSEIKFSEVTLKKILTDAEINFKFAVLNDSALEYTSVIECIDLQLDLQIFNNQQKLICQGEKSAMATIVFLIKEYYGSLSNFILSSQQKDKSLHIAGNTSEKDIINAF